MTGIFHFRTKRTGKQEFSSANAAAGENAARSFQNENPIRGGFFLLRGFFSRLSAGDPFGRTGLCKGSPADSRNTRPQAREPLLWTGISKPFF